jgi:archaellum component FlaF (FlaF/FlaG flagellin family)
MIKLPGIFKKKTYHDFDISKDERPVITVSINKNENGDTTVSGGMVFVNSKETIVFDGVVSSKSEENEDGFPFKTATLTRRRTGKVLAVCENGKWAWVENKDPLKPALKMLKSYLHGAIQTA